MSASIQSRRASPSTGSLRCTSWYVIYSRHQYSSSSSNMGVSLSRRGLTKSSFAMSASIQSRRACPSTSSPHCTSWYAIYSRHQYSSSSSNIGIRLSRRGLTKTSFAMSASIQSRRACPSTGSPHCTSWYVLYSRHQYSSSSSNIGIRLSRRGLTKSSFAMSASIQSRRASPSTGSPRCTSWYAIFWDSG